jgi:integrase
MAYTPQIYPHGRPAATRSSQQGGRIHLREQLLAWLKVAIENRDADMWVLAATSGMRRSELAGADRALLDLEDEDPATLTLEDTRVVVNGKAEDSDGKTDSSNRTISLDLLTVAYLRKHLKTLDSERKDFGPDLRQQRQAVLPSERQADPSRHHYAPVQPPGRHNRDFADVGTRRTCATRTPRCHSMQGLTAKS